MTSEFEDEVAPSWGGRRPAGHGHVLVLYAIGIVGLVFVSRG